MRTRFARRHGLAVLAACLAVTTIACGGDDDGPASSNASGGTGGEPVSGGTLTYLHAGRGLTDAPFEPADVSNEMDAAGTYLNAVFGMLVYEDYESHEVVPWMAESLTPTDATHWVLTLREGVTFTDGTPFDAEAVKFNWERAEDVTTTPSGTVATSIASMTVADPLTLNIELREPNSAFDHTVARNLAFVGSPTALRADEREFLQSAPVGAGPFVLRSIGADGTMELERNPSYWDHPRPYLDRLTIRHVTDDQQRLNTYVSGDGQLMLASPTLDLSTAPGSVIEVGTPGGGGGLTFNTARPPFDDRNARLAVQHALDRDQVNQTILSGRGTEMASMFREDSPFHHPDAAFPDFDPDEAQRLFDEYADEHGEPMQIQFTAVEQPGGPSLPEYFQSVLEDYDNVEVELNLMSPPEYFPGLLQGAFDIAVFPWAADNPLSDFRDLYGTGGSLNVGGYSNDVVDRLLSEAASTTDEAEQAELFGRVQEILVNEDAVAYFLFQVPSRAVRADAVQDLQYAVDGIWLWDRVWLAGQ